MKSTHHLNPMDQRNDEQREDNNMKAVNHKNKQESTYILYQMQKQILTPENLMENVIGCGPFQWMMIFAVSVMTKIPTAATFMFMSFGNYNPGWRCMDNITTSNYSIISDLTTNHSAYKYSMGSCEVYESCKNVEFNPDSSTIVTEWGLLCNRSWISSLIISLQMVGALIGSIIAGYLGDYLGRKTVVYGCVLSIAVLNIISMFLPSWYMFAIVRFLLGLSAASMLCSYFVLCNEFIPNKWRGPNSAIPGWQVGGILFSVIAMMTKDWRIVHLSTGILAFIGFLPVFWVPESIRWLGVKNKQKQFINVAEKMTKMNKKELPPVQMLKTIARNVSDKSGGELKKYNLSYLFRPDFRKYTIIIACVWMSYSIIFYSISFGVKRLYGDFYINLILVFLFELPIMALTSVIPNLLGRTKGAMLMVLVTAVCISIATGLELGGSNSERSVASIMLLLAKVFINGSWYIVILLTNEIYPTVVRSLGLGWASFMTRAGGVIAPFIIPNDPSSIPIAYAAMAIISFLCCVGIMQFPETRGQPLHDTFKMGHNDDDDDDDE